MKSKPQLDLFIVEDPDPETPDEMVFQAKFGLPTGAALAALALLFFAVAGVTIAKSD